MASSVAQSARRRTGKVASVALQQTRRSIRAQLGEHRHQRRHGVKLLRRRGGGCRSCRRRRRRGGCIDRRGNFHGRGRRRRRDTRARSNTSHDALEARRLSQRRKVGIVLELRNIVVPVRRSSLKLRKRLHNVAAKRWRKPRCTQALGPPATPATRPPASLLPSRTDAARSTCSCG